ncbi:MAG TPA: HU family DNA-binding protein [Pyrinomonadaceae bacterium]|nr:HU family DNA-binding protein [Pyrinomonadaceae bacterium]
MATAKKETTKAASAAKEKSISELVSALAEKTGLSKAKAKEVLDAHADLLTNELQTAGSVQLAGIGKLKLGTRAERQGRNPSTGEAITIKASKTVKFSGGKKFKDSFN